MDYLIVLALAVFVVTIFGHLLWLFFAAVFQAVFGMPEESPPADRERAPCLHCGHRRPQPGRPCPGCSLPYHAGRAAEWRDLKTTLRMLDRLQQQGAIEPATFEQLTEKIAAHGKTLQETPSGIPAVTLVRERVAQPAPPAPAEVPIAVPLQTDASTEPPPAPPPPGESPASVEPPPVATPVPDVSPVSPPPPSRMTWGEMLQGFLQERNILWGEIIGGLIVIGFSIALVISLWRTLEQIPYFPFFLFVAVTASFFGVGLYTLERWKLETTSRSLLVIALLMVPLDFLAMASLSRGEAAGLGLRLGAEAAALLLFSLLGLRAARVLLPGCAGSFTTALLVVSASQLLVPWLLQADGPWSVHPALVGMLPALAFVLTVGAVWRRAAVPPELAASQARELLFLLGLLGFAVATALGLVLFHKNLLEGLWHVSRDLAMLLTLTALPATATGLLVHRRLEPQSDNYVRVAGTILALLGVFLQVGAVALGWFDPIQLLGVCVLNLASLTLLAWRFGLPLLHGPALACAALALLTAWHMAAGAFAAETDATAFLLPVNGFLLAGLSLALVLAAELWLRVDRRTDGAAYSLGSLALGVLALLLLANGQASGSWRALVEGLFALAAFAGAWRWRLPALTCLGIALAFDTSLLLLPAKPTDAHWLHSRMPLLLGFATAGLGLHAWLRRRSNAEMERVFGVPLFFAGLLFSLAAVPFFLEGLDAAHLTFLTAMGLWLFGLCFYLAWQGRNPLWFAAAQIMLFLSVGFGVTRWLLAREWVVDLPVDLLDYRSLQAYGTAWAVVCLGWAALRRSPAAWGLRFDAPHVLLPDRILLVLLVLGVLGMTAFALFPAWQGELFDLQGYTVAAQAFGPGAWLLWGACLAVLLVDLWGRWTAYHLHLLLQLLPTAALLAAGPMAAQHAALATTLWGLALLYLGGTLVLETRQTWWLLTRRLRFRLHLPRRWSHDARAHWMMTTAIPVILATLSLFHITFLEGPRIGPVDGNLFAWMGATAAAVTPLLWIALAWVILAWQRRSQGWAFSGGLLVLATVLCGHAYRLAWIGRQIGGIEAYRLLQLLTLTTAAWTLGWAGLLWVRLRWRAVAELRHPLLFFQMHMPVVGVLLLLSIPSLMLLIHPLEPADLVRFAGGGVNWLAVLLTFGAATIVYWIAERPRAARVILYAGGAGAVQIACMLASWDTAGLWLSFHGLLVGWIITVWSAWLMGRGWAEPRPWPALLWVLAMGIVALGLRGMGVDPQQPYWSAAAFLAMSVFAAVCARQYKQPGFVLLGVLLSALATTACHLAVTPQTESDLLHWTTLGVAAFALAWALAARWVQRDGDADILHFRVIFLSGIALLFEGAFILMAWCSALNMSFPEVPVPSTLVWPVLAMLALAWAALWRWTAARWGDLALYLLGIMMVGLALVEAELSPLRLGWATGLALAAFHAAASGVLWGCCRGGRRQPAEWILPVQLLVGTIVLLFSLWMTLDFMPWMDRLGGAAAVLLLTGSSLLLTQALPEGKHTMPGQRVTLFLAIGVIQMLAWTFLDRDALLYWLHATISFAAVMAALAWALLLLPARWGTWTPVARRTGLLLGFVSMAAVVLVLVQEFLAFQPALNKAPIGATALGAMLLTLLGLLALLLRCAVLPERDPWHLTERGRHAYVYLAEVVLLLLFCHLRLTWPEIFPRDAGRYWMFIVMGIAFVGIGLATVFQRLGLPVLSQPLARTGLFLPLLPLLAFWLKPSAAVRDALRGSLVEVLPGGVPFLRYLENLPSRYDWYGLLLFFAGAVYGFVAVTRRSFGFALIAALTANFGLWALLQHHGLHFFLHPQAWMIPLAVILLVTERLHRGRLTETQAVTLRYAALMMLYIASTADMFITGLGQSVMLPLLLAVLAVLGVFVGILLRIKAYLFLGATFLLVDIGSLVWHAAFDRRQMWVLWACGVALGVVVLALFAYFEKHRQQVVVALNDFRHWE